MQTEPAMSVSGLHVVRRVIYKDDCPRRRNVKKSLRFQVKRHFIFEKAELSGIRHPAKGHEGCKAVLEVRSSATLLIGREDYSSATARPLVSRLHYFAVYKEVAVEPARESVLHVDIPPKCRKRVSEAGLNALTPDNDVGPPPQKEHVPQLVSIHAETSGELSFPMTSCVARGIKKNAVNVQRNYNAGQRSHVVSHCQTSRRTGTLASCSSTIITKDKTLQSIDNSLCLIQVRRRWRIKSVANPPCSLTTFGDRSTI